MISLILQVIAVNKITKIIRAKPLWPFLISVFANKTIIVVCQLYNYLDPERIGKHFFLR